METNNSVTKSIIYAFAINNNGMFENEHFGEADKFMIYKADSNGFNLISEKVNDFKSEDENHKHGLKSKGEAISKFFREFKVNALVSRQFGKNIKMVNGM